MLKSHYNCLAGFFLLSVGASTAWAHYLWVAVDTKTGEQGTANIYFEEGPAPGNGEYLDPFVERGITWIRTVEKPKTEAVKTTEMKANGKRWLSLALTAAAPRSIDSYGKWGVYRYGQTDVLLHYYARNLDVKDHDDLHTLARAEQMDLDIVLHEHEGTVEVKIVWKNNPAPKCGVQVFGPAKFQQSLKTDDKGMTSFKPETAGTYRLKASVEEPQGGKFEEKTYQKIRHTATMVIYLPLPSGL